MLQANPLGSMVCNTQNKVSFGLARKFNDAEKKNKTGVLY